MDQFRAHLRELLPPGASGNLPEPATPRPYQIGPAAGATYDFIIALLQYGDHFLHNSADYLARRAALVAAGKRWRVLIRHICPEIALTECDAVIFPRCLLEAICFKNARDRYGITHRSTVQSHSRDFYYTDGRRPTGHSIHTIAIRSGGKTYVYVVNGRAKAIEHMMIDGAKVPTLALLDWFPPPD